MIPEILWALPRDHDFLGNPDNWAELEQKVYTSLDLDGRLDVIMKLGSEITREPLKGHLSHALSCRTFDELFNTMVELGKIQQSRDNVERV